MDNQSNLEQLLDNKFVVLKDKLKYFFKDEMKSMAEEIRDFKTLIEFVSDKYDDMIKENKDLKNEISLIKKDNQQNTEDIKTLKIENEKLVNKINGLENSTRLTNIELHGITRKNRTKM